MRVLDPNDPAEVLEAAADALEVYGRVNGVGEEADGRMCVLGAIAYALGEVPMEWHRPNVLLCPAASLLAEHLTRLKPTYSRLPWDFRVWTWNDSHATTDDEVIDTLRRCAKDLRNGEAK